MLRRNPWIWAVGIEDTFIGQTARGERALDEFDLTQHTRFWRSDLELARGLGVAMIRYGIPWYKVEPHPGQFDWTWVDQVVDYFTDHGELTPIFDLVHYGTPLWLENEFANPDYPARVALYAHEFARRYRSLARYFTPLNEPMITAEWCGWSGKWPPYLQGHSGFVAIMYQLCRGIVETVRAIREVNPAAVMVHVEASKKYVPADGEAVAECAFWNEFRFIMWELIQGKVTDQHPLYKWLIRCGLQTEQLFWFEQHAIDVDVIGLNYYPQFSLNLVHAGDFEHERIPVPVPAWGAELIEIVTETYARYRRPIFITETSYWGTVDERIRWMDELVNACDAIIRSGTDLCGVTWFPFISMVDWEYRTNGLPVDQNFATFGLYDLKPNGDGMLERVPTAAADHFANLVGQVRR